jgi:hypothetical protein
MAMFDHEWDRKREYLSMHNLIAGGILVRNSYALFGIALAFTKASVLLLYKPVTDAVRYTRILWWIVFATIWIWLALFEINAFLQKKNVAFSILAYNIAFGLNLYGVITDFMVVMLPVGVIWRYLRLGIRERVGLAAFFVVGLIASCVGVTRVTLMKIQSDKPSYDVTLWYPVNLMLCSMELNLGIVRSPFKPHS